MELMYKERFFNFSPTAHKDEWLLSSLKTIFKTLADIFIADPICTDLMQCVSMTITDTIIVATQDKAQS
jgi:hypothetical protein